MISPTIQLKLRRKYGEQALIAKNNSKINHLSETISKVSNLQKLRSHLSMHLRSASCKNKQQYNKQRRIEDEGLIIGNQSKPSFILNKTMNMNSLYNSRQSKINEESRESEPFDQIISSNLKLGLAPESTSPKYPLKQQPDISLQSKMQFFKAKRQYRLLSLSKQFEQDDKKNIQNELYELHSKSFTIKQLKPEPKNILLTKSKSVAIQKMNKTNNQTNFLYVPNYGKTYGSYYQIVALNKKFHNSRYFSNKQEMGLITNDKQTGIHQELQNRYRSRITTKYYSFYEKLNNNSKSNTKINSFINKNKSSKLERQANKIHYRMADRKHLNQNVEPWKNDDHSVADCFQCTSS